MIISKKHKFVYIDIPKTGSCTIDRILMNHYQGDMINNLPEEKTGFKHRRAIPETAADFDVITSVRNPYDRILSMYFFVKPNSSTINTFEDLLDLLLTNLYSPTPYYLWFPQWKYLEPVGAPTHIIRLEHIQHDFSCLPYIPSHPVNIPHIQKSKYDETITLTNERLDKINEWAGKDFEMFNYEKRI